MKFCHNDECRKPLGGDYVHVELIGRDGPRSPVDFCDCHCLAVWSRWVSDEADKRIAKMKAQGN